VHCAFPCSFSGNHAIPVIGGFLRDESKKLFGYGARFTALVSTFECGLYRLKGLDGDSPGADLVYDFGGTRCAVPVQIDSFWIQTVVPNSLVALDIADPSKPKEISRLALGQWDWPHWMSIEPQRRRFVLTGYGGLSDRVVLGSIGKRVDMWLFINHNCP
jgi:hypothetical protein